MGLSPECLQFLGMPAIIRSQSMRRLMATVERVAGTSAGVLITGESGSGKEVIARAIHHYSLRCSGPFVDVNCAALPDHLLESELFGYEKGAFSGAETVKPGLFEMAHAGTLLLDEIAELEPKMQVKLLRVLDGTPYYRLGGQKKIVADVRVLAATSQNLEQAISGGRFRSDLYHRLSQIHLEVPPLRERPEDVVALAEFFLARQRPGLRLSAESWKRFQSYTWPGNVREMRNAVMAAAALARGEEIEPGDLPGPLQQKMPTASPTWEFSLENLERRLILEALSKTGRHQQRAADALGISRRTLSRKLRLYRMQDRMEETGRPCA